MACLPERSLPFILAALPSSGAVEFGTGIQYGRHARIWLVTIRRIMWLRFRIRATPVLERSRRREMFDQEEIFGTLLGTNTHPWGRQCHLVSCMGALSFLDDCQIVLFQVIGYNNFLFSFHMYALKYIYVSLIQRMKQWLWLIIRKIAVIAMEKII